MKSILVVESSPRGEMSLSAKLTRAIVEKMKSKTPNADVRVKNLTKNPFPHLEESQVAAFFAPPEKRTPADLAAIRNSDEAIEEIFDADTIVIGVPMFNFSIPSVLKAWIDHIARAGVTFKYGPRGPEGLVTGKKVYLAVASGSVYSAGPMKAYDFAEPYLRAVLGFLGMTDVTTFRVEGTSIPDLKNAALAKAIESIKF